MRISDWSSDVCSSDLIDLLLRRHRARILAVAFGGRDNVACRCTLVHCRRCRIAHIRADASIGGACVGRLQQTVLGGAARGLPAVHSFQGLTTDRKSLVEGKSGSVSVELGGSCFLKKKQKQLITDVVHSRTKYTHN